VSPVGGAATHGPEPSRDSRYSTRYSTAPAPGATAATRGTGGVRSGREGTARHAIGKGGAGWGRLAWGGLPAEVDAVAFDARDMQVGGGTPEDGVGLDTDGVAEGDVALEVEVPGADNDVVAVVGLEAAEGQELVGDLLGSARPSWVRVVQEGPALVLSSIGKALAKHNFVGGHHGRVQGDVPRDSDRRGGE
jgi:hypothetical protein